MLTLMSTFAYRWAEAVIDAQDTLLKQQLSHSAADVTGRVWTNIVTVRKERRRILKLSQAHGTTVLASYLWMAHGCFLDALLLMSYQTS